MSEGDTRDEALANIKEALELWLEVTIEDGGDALLETPGLVAAQIESVLEDREEFGWDRSVETATIEIALPVPV
jgi:hypothetical protein